MHYEILDQKSGELTGHFENLTEAKAEAERLCNANERKRHFTVMRIEDVWATATLGELHDDPGVADWHRRSMVRLAIKEGKLPRPPQSIQIHSALGERIA